MGCRLLGDGPGLDAEDWEEMSENPLNDEDAVQCRLMSEELFKLMKVWRASGRTTDQAARALLASLVPFITSSGDPERALEEMVEAVRVMMNAAIAHREKEKKEALQ